MKAVYERKVAFIRYAAKGRIMFLGQDLLDFIEAHRTPAVGERGRRAARESIAKK